MFASPRPSLSTDAQDWVDEFDAYTFTTPASAAPYRSVVVAQPSIADAMDFAAMDQDLKDGIMDAIEATVETGYVADTGEPSNYSYDYPTYPSAYPSSLNLTRPEAIATHSAKVAHALWLEVNGTLPWRLSDYSEAELRLLLDPEASLLYHLWDLNGGTPAQFPTFCDHSPKLIYDKAASYVGSAKNRTEALASLIEWGELFSHSPYPNGYCSAHIGDVDRVGDRLARGGCPYASRLMAAAARSVNIPAQVYEGKYNGGFHTNVAFPRMSSSDGLVLSHGDDLYTADVVGMPSTVRCCPYSDWLANVYPLSQPELDVQSVRRKVLRTTQWINSNIKSAFTTPSNGWYYISGGIGNYGNHFPPYLTLSEQAGFYDSLVALTGVDGMPEKPDATNTGTSGSLTGTSGRTISTPGTLVEDEDITGTLTINAANVTISNCRISGTNGVVVNSGIQNATIVDCEITGCTLAGVTGMPAIIRRCYFHGNTGNDIALTGTGYSGATTAVDYCCIDTGSNGYAVRITSPSENVQVRWSTIVSTASVPAIFSESLPAGEVWIWQNWISGGTYAILQTVASGTLVINTNRFGRTSTSGIFQNSAGGPPLWYINTYEDDGSAADSTDTAPL